MHIDEILRPHRRCLSEAKRSAYQYFVHTADLSALIGIKLSLEERQEAGWSVGARVDDVGKGGPLWSPGGGGVLAFPAREHREQDAGDHKGPPRRSSPPSPLQMLMSFVLGGCLLPPIYRPSR